MRGREIWWTASAERKRGCGWNDWEWIVTRDAVPPFSLQGSIQQLVLKADPTAPDDQCEEDDPYVSVEVCLASAAPNLELFLPLVVGKGHYSKLCGLQYIEENLNVTEINENLSLHLQRFRKILLFRHDKLVVATLHFLQVASLYVFWSCVVQTLWQKRIDSDIQFPFLKLLLPVLFLPAGVWIWERRWCLWRHGGKRRSEEDCGRERVQHGAYVHTHTHTLPRSFPFSWGWTRTKANSSYPYWPGGDWNMVICAAPCQLSALWKGKQEYSRAAEERQCERRVTLACFASRNRPTCQGNFQGRTESSKEQLERLRNILYFSSELLTNVCKLFPLVLSQWLQPQISSTNVSYGANL